MELYACYLVVAVAAREHEGAVRLLTMNSRRRFPRYSVHAPLVLHLARSGQHEIIHGTALDLGEGGVGGVLEGQLAADESVLLHIPLPECDTVFQPRAKVRYRNGAAHGFEFVNLSALQQAEIRRCCRKLANA